jgi:hypothetical protein
MLSDPVLGVMDPISANVAERSKCATDDRGGGVDERGIVKELSAEVTTLDGAVGTRVKLLPK